MKYSYHQKISKNYWRKFNCSGVEFDDHIKISWQGEYKTVQEICLLAYGSDDMNFVDQCVAVVKIYL